MMNMILYKDADPSWEANVAANKATHSPYRLMSQKTSNYGAICGQKPAKPAIPFLDASDFFPIEYKGEHDEHR